MFGVCAQKIISSFVVVPVGGFALWDESVACDSSNDIHVSPVFVTKTTKTSAITIQIPTTIRSHLFAALKIILKFFFRQNFFCSVK